MSKKTISKLHDVIEGLNARLEKETALHLEADSKRLKAEGDLAVARDDIDRYRNALDTALRRDTTAAQVQAWLTARVEQAEAGGHEDVATDLTQAKLLIRRAEEKEKLDGDR